MRTKTKRQLRTSARALIARASLSALTALHAMSLSGCGEEEEVVVERGIPSQYRQRINSSPKSTSKASGPAAAPGRDISARLIIPIRLKRAELIESKGWDDFRKIRERITYARDPFWPDIPELKDQEEVEVDPSSMQRRLVVAVNENHNLLKFKGTLTGATADLAMLEDGAGTGYTVRVGDIIGKAPVFVRVSMITTNKIFFAPVLGLPDDIEADDPQLSKTLHDEGGKGLSGGGE